MGMQFLCYITLLQFNISSKNKRKKKHHSFNIHIDKVCLLTSFVFRYSLSSQVPVQTSSTVQLHNKSMHFFLHVYECWLEKC